MKYQKEREGAAFTVTLVPEPGVDGIKALRWVLKSALRRHGLRCTDIHAEQQCGPSPALKEAR
jgi:hypothetical protein